MTNRFAEMDCFVLAGGERNAERDFEPVGEVTRLEQVYRRYAAVFENVFLVLKKDQAKERYLNYPHVCGDHWERAPVIGLRTALEQARSEAVFIGNSGITDFPLHLVVDLVKSYNGELFLGYCDSSRPDRHQPWFGVFSKRLIQRLADTGVRSLNLAELLGRVGRIVPLPPDIPAEWVGLA